MRAVTAFLAKLVQIVTLVPVRISSIMPVTTVMNPVQTSAFDVKIMQLLLMKSYTTS